MAFACLKDSELTYSFHYSQTEWVVLKAQAREHNLIMPCCGLPAILKTSALGTQFFAHKGKISMGCSGSDGESREHQFAKYLVSKTLHEMGWHVEVEKNGQTDAGDTWIADIFAEKGKARMAVEIQWSPQSYKETQRRQSLYDRSNIRCVWLLRGSRTKKHNALMGDYAYRRKSLLVFTLSQDHDKYMRVHNSYLFDRRLAAFTPISLELVDFIKQLFGGYYEFITRDHGERYLSVEIMQTNCWRCHKDIQPVNGAFYHDYAYGKWTRVADEASEIRELPIQEIQLINREFLAEFQFSPLRERYSKTAKTSYMANSCPHCEALIGRFFSITEYISCQRIESRKVLTTSTHEFGGIGQWVLNVDTYKPVHYHLDEANEFVDVVLSHYPELGSLHNYMD